MLLHLSLLTDARMVFGRRVQPRYRPVSTHAALLSHASLDDGLGIRRGFDCLSWSVMSDSEVRRRVLFGATGQVLIPCVVL